MSSPTAWWGLAKWEKKKLQAQRLAGQFGGQTAAGARRAPYFWPQAGFDSAAASRAGITPRDDIWQALDSFARHVEGIMADAF